MVKLKAILIVLMMCLSGLSLLVPVTGADPAPAMEPMSTEARTVVTELFTGATCGPCTNADLGLGDFLADHDREEVVALVYHRPIPGADKLATAETATRHVWYSTTGSTSTPNMWVDGKIMRIGGFSTRAEGETWWENQYNSRKNIVSQINITADGFISPSLTGTVWINVTALETPSLSNLYLHVVIVRREYHWLAPNNVPDHHYLVRKMLPNADGEALSLSVGTPVSKQYSFDLSGDGSGTDMWTVEDDMAVVAFVQTHNRQDGGSSRYIAEILQAQYANLRTVPNIAPTIRNGQAVVPAGATEDDEITLKVFYRDVDDYTNKGPTEAKVYYKNGTSPEVSANLLTVPSGDPYTIGKWLAFTTKLPQGTYTYRFSANDGEDDATGDTGWNATQFSILPRNKLPRLSENTFSPAIGDTTQVFRFSVLYMDLDNEAPTEAKIYIDTVGYDMTTDSSGPWASWVTYYYDTTLSVGSNHRYYFTFSDGEAEVRLPRADASPNWYLGPEVEAPNGPPTLTTALFTPNEGTRADEFTFSVIYTDGEDDHPISSLVFVDGVAYIMSTTSTSYVGGALYKFRTTLSLGDHEFHFSFDDGKNEVRYPLTGDLPGPTVVNLDPVAKITSPVDGERYVPDDYVSFNAMQSDDPDLDQLSFVWTSSRDGPLGSLGSFDKQLTKGEHIITLVATDDYGGSSTASVTINVEPREPHVFVAAVASEPLDPIEGDVVKYTVTLNNDGEARAQGVDVLFLVDGTQVSFEPVSVEIGISIDVRFTWKSVAGEHTITVEVGEEMESLTESVATNTLPAVEPSVSGEGGVTEDFKVGTSVFFDVDTSDADGDEVTYLWDFGDGMTSTQPNPTHSYTDPNTYTVRVTVTDSRGGVTYKEMTVTVVKPASEDSPGFGALLMATALIAAVLAALVRRED